MQRVSSGYTIVEVMIFLAISAGLLIAAMGTISGKQEQTQFNQKMRDTQSKIQDWLNDVSTGFTGGTPSQQSCFTNGPGGRPKLKNAAPDSTYTPECIFLGKAIQFTDANAPFTTSQADKLYVYSLFGQRVSSATGLFPTNLTEANPVAATAQNNSGDLDLTETFSLSPAYVKSISSNPVSNSHMIGIFSSFNSGGTANGNSDVNLYEYNFGGSAKPGNDSAGNAVNSCLDSGCSTSFLTNYQICLSDGHQTARLTISTSGSGIGAQTKLEYAAC